MFRVYLFALEGSLSKLDVLNQIYNIMLNITIPCRHNALSNLLIIGYLYKIIIIIYMFFSFEGGRIHYSDSGKGSVIVLLHGYLESAEVWNGFSEKLASAFRVITVDLPGCGLSDAISTNRQTSYLFRKSIAYLRVVSICSQIG
jgi:hypothetical protein